jgi:tellurite resistance protein TerC
MGTPALWIIFNAGVLLLLVLDLGILNRRAHDVSMREAAAWSVFWVAISIAFNLWILHAHGGEKALQFFTGYLIEQSMSVDNIFIFILVFRSFGVERQYQHRVLFWGILGALILRGTMIGLGTALIRKFEWALYVLAALLVVAAMRMLFRKETEPHPERGRLLRWAQKIFPFTHNYHGQKFWIREAGKRMATPLLLVLLVVEVTDFVFALDSIPAVFGVSRDPFIVYSSNICAILGLRAFYFLLAGFLPAFRYLDEGLAVVLLFVGVEMLGAHWVQVSTEMTLGIIAGILTISVLASIIALRREKRRSEIGNELKSGDK